MSSFAAIPIDMVNDEIPFLAASSNKNLEGVPGISFVLANHQALDHISDYPKRTLYLDLYDQYQHFKDTGQFRFTPAIQCLYALEKAVALIEKEGIKHRYNRYKKRWTQLISGLRQLGYKTVLADDLSGQLISPIQFPDIPQFSFDKLHDFLYEKLITIYPGKLSDYPCFRVSSIGQLTEKDIEHVINAFKEFQKAYKIKL